MEILPFQFEPGQSVKSLGLTGEEIFHIDGLAALLGSKFANGKTLTVLVEARTENEVGLTRTLPVHVRIHTPQEILYYQHGGILNSAANRSQSPLVNLGTGGAAIELSARMNSASARSYCLCHARNEATRKSIPAVNPKNYPLYRAIHIETSDGEGH
jgi:hypothetical protein